MLLLTYTTAAGKSGYSGHMAKPTTQTMKPSTAAKKLGVYLPATPEEFRAEPISREQLQEWDENPPEWLTSLRRNGPHPKQVVAARLRISNSGLARGGITDPLTSEQINELIAAQPDWLVAEQKSFEEVRREDRRIAGLRRDAED